MEPQGRIVQHFLSPARALTRDRLITAAIELATEGGYDAVGVRPVAARAGVSVPTAYQHVSSKDQLLLEALMSLGRQSTDQVRRRPPTRHRPAERLISVFEQILREAAAKPLLYRALYRGYIANAPSLIEGEEAIGFGPENAAWIGETLRAGQPSELDEDQITSASRILSCLFLGTMINVAAGRSVDDVLNILTEATNRLLP